MNEGLEDAAAAKEEGNEKFKAKEYQEAVDAYSRSLALKPDQHLCYSNRCAAYLKLGGYDDQALVDAEKCTELMPSWAKGYRRVHDALVQLKRVGEAVAVLEKGLTLVPEEEKEGLDKMIKEVPKKQFTQNLLGTWHGTVNEVLGGYDQEMEFVDEIQVRIEVLGRSIVGKYWVDVSQEPHHLNIQVPQGDVPPGMPPPPPVPYIARVDEVGLHLCCPYLKMERPTEFTGPGYVLMKNGGSEKADNSVLEGLSHKEKCQKCAQELLKVMPNRKLDEVNGSDSEEAAGEKLMSQVRFESSMFGVCKMFGEEVVKEVLAATRGSVNSELESIKEIPQLTEKLRICGILEEEGPGAAQAPSTVAGSAAASGSTAASAGPAATTAAKAQETVPASEKAASIRPSSGEESGSVSCSTAVGGVLLSAAALATVAFMLSRKNRS